MRRVMGFCGGLLFAFLTGAAAADPVATRDFVRKDEYQSAKISPNGGYLALATPIEGQTALGVLDLKTRKMSGALQFSRGEHVFDYWWVSPSRIVVSISKSFGPLDQPRLTGELYAMNADGSEKRYLFGYRGANETDTILKGVVKEYATAYMFDSLRDDPDHALIAVVPWTRAENSFLQIELISVKNGKRKRVDVVPTYPPGSFAADREGVPRFAYGVDEKSQYQLFARARKGEDWKRVPTPNGPHENIRLYSLAGNGESAYLSSSEKSGRSCLREYRFQTGQMAELSCNDTVSVGHVIFAFDSSFPIAVMYENGRPESVYLQPDHPDAKLLRMLENSFKGQRVRVTSGTTDGNKLVLYVDSDRNPGDFYLFDRATKKAEYLISRRGWINPKTMQPVEPIQYKTRDGATIHGYLTAQAGLQAKEVPLVLMPHGGPHGIRDYWEWDARAQFLASRGYAVLQPNYRGSGGYGEAFEQAGYRKWGTLMQDDLTDAVRWAVAQGIADSDRVCIVGFGNGGYSALMSAEREPDFYRCAAAFAGVYDLESQSEEGEMADSLYRRSFNEKVLGTDKKVLAEQSPVTYIEKLKVPVLIAHGTADKRVPFSQAKLLRKALEKHGKPYEWMEFDGEEHGFYKDENHEDFLNKLVEFLDKHIGPASPAATGQAKSTGGS